MSNLKESPYPPEVKIMLDRERTMKFPVPSIFALEDLTGLDITGKGVSDQEEFYGGTKDKPATVRQRLERTIDVIWAGCLAEDPGITRELVANYVFISNFRELDEKCAYAFQAALVAPNAEGEHSSPLKLTKKVAPSAASKSGRSHARI